MCSFGFSSFRLRFSCYSSGAYGFSGFLLVSPIIIFSLLDSEFSAFPASFSCFISGRFLGLEVEVVVVYFYDPQFYC